MRKNPFGVSFGLMGKNNLRYSFWSRHRQKYEKTHEPFSMMVTTLIFTPQKGKASFSLVERLFGGGCTNRTIRLSLSFTLMCGLLGFDPHNFFSSGVISTTPVLRRRNRLYHPHVASSQQQKQRARFRVSFDRPIQLCHACRF